MRDSASVQIVDNLAPAWSAGDAWSVSTEPLLSIGTVDGAPEYVFSRLTGLMTLTDDRLVVLDGGSTTIRFYDADGVYLSSAGGQGQGPGEYIDMARIGRLLGDSILVADGIAQRISFLDSMGTYVRSIGLELAEGFSNVGFYNTLGALETGRILAYSGSGRGFREEDEGSAILDTLHYFWFQSTGEYGGRLSSLPGRPRWALRTGSGVGFPYVPLSGGPVAAAGTDRFVVSRGVEPELLVFDAEGQLKRLIRWPGGGAAVDVGMADRWLEAVLRSETTDAERRANRRLISDAQLSESVPATSAILVDKSEHIWAEKYRTPWETQPVWEVFDADGRWLGSVQTPPRLRIYEIGPDYLLGSWRDDLDVEYVRLYSLRRTD